MDCAKRPSVDKWSSRVIQASNIKRTLKFVILSDIVYCFDNCCNSCKFHKFGGRCYKSHTCFNFGRQCWKFSGWYYWHKLWIDKREHDCNSQHILYNLITCNRPYLSIMWTLLFNWHRHDTWKPIKVLFKMKFFNLQWHFMFSF